MIFGDQSLGKSMLPCLRTKGPRLMPNAGRTTIITRLNDLQHQVSTVNMLVKGCSFLGYHYAHRRTLHFISSSKGNNFQLDSVLPLLLTKPMVKLSQVLEYIFLNLCSLTASCTLHCQEVFLAKLHSFCPEQIKTLTQQAKEQKILYAEMYSRM